MKARLMLVCAAVAALGVAVPARAHQCVDVANTNTATATVGAITVTMTETQRVVDCNVVGASAPIQRLEISGGGYDCVRTDVDPSFDPFFFGGGIHPAVKGDCGADLTWSSFDPMTPVASNEGVNAKAGIGKDVPASGTIWKGADEITVTDAPGRVEKTVTTDVIID